jgi:hypothetical protein
MGQWDKVNLTHIAALPPKIDKNAVNNSVFINNL